MTIILDGKNLSKKIIEDIKINTTKYEKKPTLAVFLVGKNPASQIYVKNKQRQAEYVGFNSIVNELPHDISENDLLEQIYIMNDSPDINAILVQLPLPENLNQQKILEAIDPIKDVDCFTSYNFGWLALGYNPYVLPCTPKGIIRLLDEYKINLEGKNAIVIGRSNIVGKPLALLLQQRNATVTTAHSRTENLKQITKEHDIVVAAIGMKEYITADYIKEGAIVIDVGINRTNEGLFGDIKYEEVKEKASYITPVPGGVGPMTIAMLLENTFELYKIQRSLVV